MANKNKKAKIVTALDKAKKLRLICTECIACAEIVDAVFTKYNSNYDILVLSKCHDKFKLLSFCDYDFKTGDILLSKMSEQYRMGKNIDIQPNTATAVKVLTEAYQALKTEADFIKTARKLGAGNKIYWCK